MVTSQWMTELMATTPQSEVNYDVASEQASYRQSLYDHYHEPSEEYIKMVYGLEPDEWVGSSANRVRTIINKNSPHDLCRAIKESVELRQFFLVAVLLLVVRHLVHNQCLCFASQRHRGQIRMKPMTALSCKPL